jgi:hypothetical protein
VKVKLYLGPLAGELAAELPFTLMHPKPEPDPDNERKGSEKRGSRWEYNFLKNSFPIEASLVNF